MLLLPKKLFEPRSSSHPFAPLFLLFLDKPWRNVGNFEIILRNLLQNLKKMYKNFGLILGKLWRNIGMTLNYKFCGCYEEY